MTKGLSAINKLMMFAYGWAMLWILNDPTETSMVIFIILTYTTSLGRYGEYLEYKRYVTDVMDEHRQYIDDIYNENIKEEDLNNG